MAPNQTAETAFIRAGEAIQLQILEDKLHIAVIGGGPGGLFLYKRLVEAGRRDVVVHVFERSDTLGAGMPYSERGANREHVTNVSGNEIPELVTPMAEWARTLDHELLRYFDINPERFNDYKVLPRLFFGMYLSEQFRLLQEQAKTAGIETHIYLETPVTDIAGGHGSAAKKGIFSAGTKKLEADVVLVATGHRWPEKQEGKVPRFYDSPYPPAKLRQVFNHPVALKGASLTAIDALRTLARANGTFSRSGEGYVTYRRSAGSPEFSMVMHSRGGLLPAVRFHLEDPTLTPDHELTGDDIARNRAANEGFLSLDYVFSRNFVAPFAEKDPEFHTRIKDMTIEDFVESMMNFREGMEPFELLRAEYTEAEKSIRHRESVHWKEMLAVLSFVMNYPAKYFSAEDKLRLDKVLQPLISVVIAFAPQQSVEEMLALQQAGALSLVNVGDESSVSAERRGGATYSYTTESGESRETYYEAFVDCSGQPKLAYDDVPFKSLLKAHTLSRASLAFRDAEQAESARDSGNENVEKDASGKYILQVPGITIDDNFRVVDPAGESHEPVYMMAVPYIGGYNPDYSGLDFCEAASERIVNDVLARFALREKIAATTPGDTHKNDK